MALPIVDVVVVVFSGSSVSSSPEQIWGFSSVEEDEDVREEEEAIGKWKQFALPPYSLLPRRSRSQSKQSFLLDLLSWSTSSSSSLFSVSVNVFAFSMFTEGKIFPSPFMLIQLILRLLEEEEEENDDDDDEDDK